MSKKFNWKLPLILLLVVGAYYLYKTKLRTPRGPLTVLADSVVFKRGCANPDSACLRLNFSFPSFTQKISGKLTQSIYSDYLLMLEDSSGVNGIGELKGRLNDISYRYDSAYVDFTGSFPNASSMAWFVNIDFEVLRNDGKILTLRYQYADYMGGAHGMHSNHYHSVDLQKSEALGLADVFESVDKLYPIAEAAFNEQHPAGQSADEFWFPDNKYVLPQEFGFSDTTFILHYNVYEIASYARGSIVVEIPYAKLKRLLKPRWSYLAN